MRVIPGGDAASFVDASLGSARRQSEATLTVSCPLAEVVDVLRWVDHTVVQDRSSTCTILIRGEDLGRMAMTVARIALDAPVAVIEPTELADATDQLATHLGQ